MIEKIEKNDLKYNKIKTLFFFILCPILALPSIYKGMYMLNRHAAFLFSLFLGCVAMLMLPLGDMYRHVYHYYDSAEMTLPILILSLGIDWFTDVVNFILSHNGIKYEWFRFFELLESFYILFLIYRYKLLFSPRLYTIRERRYWLWVLFLFFELSYTIIGVRFGFALCQFLFGTHLYFERKQKLLGCFFFYFSVSIHTSFMMFIPIIFLLSYTIKNKYYFFLVVILLFMVASTLLSKYSFLLGARANWYFEGGSNISGEGFENVTINGLIVNWVPIILTVPLYLWILSKGQFSTIWQKMMFSWLALFIIFITNAVLFKRVSWGAQAVLVFVLMDIDYKALLPQKIKNYVLTTGVLISLLNAVNYGHSYYANSRMEYLVAPLPIILTNEYSQAWVDKHIDNNEVISPKEGLFE